jgi:NTP pyrophosphatase (non-canonical NTP hydrolase)
MSAREQKEVNEILESIGACAYEISRKHGFHQQPPTDAAIVAHLTGEAGELWEWYRKGNPASDHIPDFTGEAEEFADIIIRVCETAHIRQIDLGAAIIAKVRFNNGREHRHGGKAC